MQKKTAANLRHRRFPLSLLLCFLMIDALASAGFAVRWHRLEQAGMAAETLAKARMVANAVNPARVATLTGTPADLQAPHYLRLKEQLMHARGAYPQCRFLYLLGVKDKEVFFFVDSEPPNSKDCSPPGLVFTEANAAIIRACESGTETFVPPYRDRWGKWVTALVPIHDFATGDVLAMLGMDLDAHLWTFDVLQHAMGPILFGVLVAAILIFFYVLLRRSEDALLLISASEAALRASQEQYRAVADYIYDWEYWYAPDKSLVYVSPSCERVTGYSAEAFLEDPGLLLSIVHPDDKALMRCHVDEMQQGDCHAQYAIDFRILARSGDVRWLSHACQRVYNQEGTYLGRRVSNRDITDRKLAEMALHESEQRVRAKLDSILLPEGDVAALDLRDLVDVVALQQLMDGFHSLTRIGMALLDIRGNVLIAVGWQDICTEFHRKNPQMCANCLESDTVLTENVKPGTFKRYRCKNGLWDMVTPLLVGGSHVGNIFIGQFLLSEEEVDFEAFRASARRHGLDEEKYMEALARVPRFNSAMVDSAMEFCRQLCDNISKASYANIKLARLVADRERLLESLQGKEALLNTTQEMAGVGGWEYDIAQNRMTWTQELYRIHELPPEDVGPVADDHVTASLACYDEPVRPLVLAAFRRCVENGEPYDLQVPFTSSKGRRLWVRTKAYAVFEDGRVARVIGSFMDITGRKQAEDFLKTALDEARSRERQISALLRASRAVLMAASFDSVAREIFDICRETTGAAAGCVTLFANNGQEEATLAFGSNTPLCDAASSPSVLGLRATACKTGTPVYGNGLFLPDHAGLRNALFAPLTLRGKTVGLLGLANKPGDGFDEDDATLARALAETVAIALQRERDAEALRESESRYRELFEAESDVILLVDNDEGRILEANHAASILYGYTHDELLAMHNIQLSAEPEKTRQINQTSMSDDQVVTVPLRLHRKKDGAVFPVEITVRFFRHRGRSVHLAAIRDISARIGIEQALRDSESRYRQLFESMTAGFALHEILLDANGLPCDYRFLEVNPAFERLMGRKAEDLVGHTVLEALPGIESWWIETYGLVATTGQSVHFENYASGIDRYFEVSAYSPAPGKFATVFQDITDRVRAKQALSDSEIRYRRLFETAREGIMTIDATTGAVIDANPALLQILGQTPEDLLRHIVWQVDVCKPLVADEAAFEQMRQGGGIRQDCLALETHDGRRVLLEFASNAYEAGQKSLVQCTIRDMTEAHQARLDRAKLEDQLRQAQKMEAIGQLAGGVAHDFNNLLQVIIGYVDILLGETQGNDKDARILGDVRKAAERAADLTRQLLAFSRRQVIQPVNLDINALVSGVLKMIRRVIGEHIELRFLPGQHLRTVRGDKGQVEQILMNLCVNARDAMPSGGRLSIETAAVDINDEYCQTHACTSIGPHVIISVTDTGCGMDEQTRSQIFEPFFTTKEMGQGTGLGLATVYGIVQQHNGWIHVYSEIGSGTVFKVYLPAIDAAPEEIENAADIPVVGGTETILVAEDEDMVRNLVVQMLTTAGYKVLVARDGEDALRLFEEHENEIDLALLDVMMPRLGGRQVMNHIQMRNLRIRFVFSSGYSENAIHTGFVIKEGLHLITKPYRRSELLKIVRSVLDAPEA